MVSGGLKGEKWPYDALKGDLGREEVLPNDMSRAKSILEQAWVLLPFGRYRWALIDLWYERLLKSVMIWKLEPMFHFSHWHFCISCRLVEEP